MSFVLYGNTTERTDVSDFFDKKLTTVERAKILATFKLIASAPLIYQHPEKFKRWEDKIWEIKQKQIRIACYWQGRGKILVLFYAFRKKSDDWPKGECIKTRRLYQECSQFDFSGV